MPVSFPSIDDGPNTYALPQGALRDAFGQLLDGNASLDTAGRSHELVEGDVAGRRQRDLLNGFRRLGSPRRAAEKLTPGFQPLAESIPSSHSRAAAGGRASRHIVIAATKSADALATGSGTKPSR